MKRKNETVPTQLRSGQSGALGKRGKKKIIRGTSHVGGYTNLHLPPRNVKEDEEVLRQRKPTMALRLVKNDQDQGLGGGKKFEKRKVKGNKGLLTPPRVDEGKS